MQLEQPERRCAWHPLYFGSPLIMQEGDATKRSDDCCPDCMAVLMNEIEARNAIQTDTPASDGFDFLQANAQPVLERLAEIERGEHRPSTEGTGRLYCIACDRWIAQAAKVIGGVRLCSCMTPLSIIPF